MLVSDIHGLEGPSFQRAGMVVSAEATLHWLEEEDVVSLSVSLVESCLIIPRECNQRGTFDAHIESTNKSCLDRWQPSQRHQAINQSINERETDRLNRASRGAALGNAILTYFCVSDNNHLQLRECHCKRRGQYSHRIQREQRAETPTTQREQQQQQQSDG